MITDISNISKKTEIRIEIFVMIWYLENVLEFISYEKNVFQSRKSNKWHWKNWIMDNEMLIFLLIVFHRYQQTLT